MNQRIGRAASLISTAVRQDRVPLAGLQSARGVYPPDVARRLSFGGPCSHGRLNGSGAAAALACSIWAKRDGTVGANC